MSKTNMPDVSSAEIRLASWQRVGVLWPAKLRLTVFLSVWFWSVYLFLSRHAALPIHRLPTTPLDDWAGFRPYPWVWIYESNFLITGIIPWLMISLSELRRYAVGFLLLSGLSFLIFIIFPVASPRPANLDTNSTLMFITRLDGPLNAFPSLHAGCLVYTLALARRIFGRHLNPVAFGCLLVWASLILFATLATKQHYAIDLLAGGLVGMGADWIAWRNSLGNLMASRIN
jgi:membrane-associated phospholipid phosphatase